jgi:alpha-D-ribose 1-methylphosphonate 5-triphosphate diphosphatase
MTSNTFVLTNVDMVLCDSVVHGSLHVVDGCIAEITDTVSTAPSAIDGDNDIVVAGLIEIHTDALEWHLRPRPESVWPADAAVAGHDAMLAASGITTVLDSLCIGDLGGDGFRSDILRDALAAITSAQTNGRTRIDHKLHYRCEVADHRTPELFEDLVSNPLLALVSLMDHTPGGRQYRDLDRYRTSNRPYRTTPSGVEDIDTYIQRLQERQAEFSAPNWERVSKLAAELGLPLASHDDATEEDIALAVRSGVTISEFPTTELAAAEAKRNGMFTAAGAPNIVRGGSHSGNVAAADLAALGLLDIVTSDYVPYSLLHAPFVLAARGVLPLPAAVALVSSGPAAAVGLTDRGRLDVGMRADLVRVRLHDGVPIVQSVYCAGRRVG